MSAEPQTTLPRDPREPIERLLRDLGVRAEGLSEREAARRLLAYGRNELRRGRGREWPRQIVNQLIHPLALLLWVAAGLALVAGTPVLCAAIVAVIVTATTMSAEASAVIEGPSVGLRFAAERVDELALEVTDQPLGLGHERSFGDDP